MTLYRHDATGFIGNFVAAPPGAGYTEIADASHGPLASVTEWWRAIDRGSLTSDWHPSLLGGTEIPKPPGLAGSGINIMAARYSSFEEPDGLPPIATNGCTVERLSGGFHGGTRLRVTATVDHGEVWLAPTANTFNIRLTPNLRWIFSAYLSAPVASQPFTALIATASANGGSGDVHTILGESGAVAGSWERRWTLLDLRQENASAALFGLRLPTAGTVLDIDAIMVEELLGDTVQPSAYYAPPVMISGDQVIPNTLSFSIAGERREYETLSAGAWHVAWPVTVPATPLFRNKILLHGLLTLQRPDASGTATFQHRIYRNGEVMHDTAITAVPGQSYVQLSILAVDPSYDINEIAYEFRLCCEEESFAWKGTAVIQEVRK